MNGATTEPCASINKPPSITETMIIGASQSFLRIFKNSQSSLIISIIIIIVIIMSLRTQGFKRYSLLMVVGGALGNLHDRFFFNAVPDFIDFHIGEFHWFIFNVADMFISLGVIFMILYELIDNNKNNDQKI